MSSTAHPLPAAPEPAALTRDILGTLCRGYPGSLAVRLWTGEAWDHGPGPAGFTLVLKHPGSLRAMLWPKDKLGLGRATGRCAPGRNLYLPDHRLPRLGGETSRSRGEATRTIFAGFASTVKAPKYFLP